MVILLKSGGCMRDIDKHYGWTINSTRKYILKNKPRCGFIFKKVNDVNLEDYEIIINGEIINMNNIIHITKDIYKTIITIVDCEIKCWESLSYFENILSDSFHRIHTKTIVNKSHISNIDKSNNYDIITMDNSNVFRLSRRNRENFYEGLNPLFFYTKLKISG